MIHKGNIFTTCRGYLKELKWGNCRDVFKWLHPRLVNAAASQSLFYSFPGQREVLFIYFVFCFRFFFFCLRYNWPLPPSSNILLGTNLIARVIYCAATPARRPRHEDLRGVKAQCVLPMTRQLKCKLTPDRHYNGWFWGEEK